MGRPAGGKNRYWSKEDKLKVIKDFYRIKNYSEACSKYDICSGTLYTWLKKYRESGEDALQPAKKPGNPLSKYTKRKHLTEVEKLQKTILEQKIEIERLKKGYQVKGAGASKEYATIQDANSKSSKN